MQVPMPVRELSADDFEGHRAHLLRVASRMLGSRRDAEDAVQETWVRAQRADVSEVDNVGGWLTTIAARVCLNALRARRSRPQEVSDVRIPDPVVVRDDGDPAREAELADAVGIAMLVVLETLTPAERLAFVLHDMFAVPFDEIAVMLERTPEAVRQLASRARRRVQDAPRPDGDRAGRRRVVDAFFAAARRGDFDALVAVLHPDVVLHADSGARLPDGGVLRGAETIAGQAIRFAQPTETLRPVLVDGTTGVLVERRGRPFALMAFTVVDGRVAEIDVINDPRRLRVLDVRDTDLR
jgi:RNA polymerase sigma-70 factor (ECF subfamily)